MAASREIRIGDRVINLDRVDSYEFDDTNKVLVFWYCDDEYAGNAARSRRFRGDRAVSAWRSLTDSVRASSPN